MTTIVSTTLTGSSIAIAASTNESYTASLRTDSVSGTVVASHNFAVSNTSLSTHKNTDWQIATDAAFTNIVWQSMANSSNKLTISNTTLSESTVYHARHRYRLNDGTVSDWSSVTFTTEGGAGFNSLLNLNGGNLTTEGIILSYDTDNDGYDQQFTFESGGTLTVGEGDDATITATTFGSRPRSSKYNGITWGTDAASNYTISWVTNVNVDNFSGSSSYSPASSGSATGDTSPSFTMTMGEGTGNTGQTSITWDITVTHDPTGDSISFSMTMNGRKDAAATTTTTTTAAPTTTTTTTTAAPTTTTTTTTADPGFDDGGDPPTNLN